MSNIRIESDIYQDVLVYLQSYPDAPSEETIARTAAYASRLGVTISAASVRIHVPLKSNPIAEALIGLNQLTQAQEQKSVENARSTLETFEIAAKSRFARADLLSANLYEEPAKAADWAKNYDLCIIPYAESGLNERAVAESVVFDSGRPVLALPFQWLSREVPRFKRVAIAWDGGRAVSRAIADGMPILEQCSEVEVLTFAGAHEKGRDPGALLNHLHRHGIEASVRSIEMEGGRVAEALRRPENLSGVDLLIMGAYGHSRAREFILGGVTDSVLTDPPLPTLLSH